MPTAKPSIKVDKKRSEILKAARLCFRKNGFHQTSMQQICAAVDLGPGAVYRYFSSKQAIIEELAREECRSARAIENSLLRESHFLDVLQSMTHAFASRHDASHDAAMMTEVYAEGMRNKRIGAIIKKAEDEWINVLADLLRTAQARAQIEPLDDARQTALFITALWDGMMIRQVFHRQTKMATMDYFESMLGKLLTRGGKRERGNRLVDSSGEPSEIEAGEDNQLTTDTRQLSLI